MKTEQVTVKTSKKARQLLRQVAAITGEKYYELLERVLNKELKKESKESF